MHFPYYFLVKNQWFEKLTKGTALGGLSPPNNIPMSPPINQPLPQNCPIFWEVELQKVFVLVVLVGLSEAEKVWKTFSKNRGFLTGAHVWPSRGRGLLIRTCHYWFIKCHMNHIWINLLRSVVWCCDECISLSYRACASCSRTPSIRRCSFLTFSSCQGEDTHKLQGCHWDARLWHNMVNNYLENKHQASVSFSVRLLLSALYLQGYC